MDCQVTRQVSPFDTRIGPVMRVLSSGDAFGLTLSRYALAA